MKRIKFENDLILLFNKVYKDMNWDYSKRQRFFINTCTNDLRDELFADILLFAKGVHQPASPIDCLDAAFELIYLKYSN